MNLSEDEHVIPSVTNTPSPDIITPNTCAGCSQLIRDRHLLKALDKYWHEDCLKCSCCDCRLGEVGATLFAKANLLLCRRDYLRLFGATGNCSACKKTIPAFEMVMRAREHVYHLECFACQQCNHRFCVGDRFYLCDNKILCEYDYEERMVFANMQFNYNALLQIKEQTKRLCAGSCSTSGGGIIGVNSSLGGNTSSINTTNNVNILGGNSIIGGNSIMGGNGGIGGNSILGGNVVKPDDASSGYGSPSPTSLC